MVVLELPQRFPCQRLGHLFHEFVPGNSLRPVIHTNHRDAFFNGAHDKAKPAADTIGFPHLGLIFSVVRKEVDALMGSVVACDVAEVTLDTFRFIDAGDCLIEEI